MTDCGLECWPPWLGQFSDLEQLDLSGNRLGSAPEAFFAQLPELTVLWLNSIALRFVPSSLCRLQKLRHLSLSANGLRFLPTEFSKLDALVELRLADNKFTEFPAPLSDLSSLVSLDIANTGRVDAVGSSHAGQITRLPVEVAELPCLAHLDVDGHPIEAPPPEVVAEGLSSVRDYFRQVHDEGFDYLCEAKLLILGEAGAGKTTLAKKLLDPSYPLSDEPSTQGIDVMEWTIPCTVTVGEPRARTVIESDFRAHIWDFGGQEIYHATHQFFLTKRSLYVLVADSRNEDTDFDYWLNVVELLADNSPLIILLNEKQDRRRSIDEGRLRARFSNLRHVLRTNLATGRGLDVLTRTIRHELGGLSHVGARLPKTWKRVRTALEADSRNHISVDEFLDVCDRHGFKKEKDKWQLGSYLHDLGICLHFQQDPLLRRTVFLKPEWGTTAVYRVLDDQQVVRQQGRFDQDDVTRIWSDGTYADMRNELLQLMVNFKLCYPLPTHDAFIAPQLLSPSRPEVPWPDGPELVVTYRYDFMPKGILTRFIVALHARIVDQRWVWRSGVLLGREGSRALVVEDYPGRTITVRVMGQDAIPLFSIIDWELGRIHQATPRLRFDKLLPCCCDLCRTSSNPHSYPLRVLRRFTDDGQPLIQCQHSYAMVRVADLVRRVFGDRPSPASRKHSRPHLLPPNQRPQPVTPPPAHEVFVSFAWSGKGLGVVEALQPVLDQRGIRLLRDVDEINYRDRIRAFMKRLGRGRCIIVVIDRPYLRSHSCMFELAEIVDAGDLAHRVFPIVLPDAGLHDAMQRLDYIQHWEARKAALDEKMRTVGQEHLDGIRREIDLYSRIRTTIATLMDTLGDMNTLTVGEHLTTDFKRLCDQLQHKLGE
ncbi:MAG: TIR domain-containing protein [Myxococcales bacterium]|nr:TIR domain-containing protein [Myxococcales bacterium]